LHAAEAAVTMATERLSDLAPVERLLCACARPADHSGSDRFSDVAWESVDWELLPRLLVRHGLQALAVSHLASARQRVPESVWRELHAGAMAARAESLALWAELQRILRRCAEVGVDALPYKGPVLGWEAYGDLGARPSVDLDLLVRPHDLDAATHTLRELGYLPAFRFSRARERWFRRVDGDYPFEHGDTGGLVELHIRAMSRRFGPQPSTSRLWQRRRAAAVLGATIAVLHENDVFYLQVVHGAKHRWERLEWIAATAELLRARDGDVSALHAAAYPNQRAVLLGCALARNLLGAPVDVGTATRIGRDREIGRLADAANRHLFRDARIDDSAVNDTAAKLWFNCRVQRGTLARARFLYRWAAWPSPEDWERLQIPDAIFFLYRLTRPFRLMWRYARRTSPSGARSDDA
jgi:Uncharacterised nucleotidyltransferase